jgi:hypothetical protein
MSITEEKTNSSDGGFTSLLHVCPPNLPFVQDCKSRLTVEVDTPIYSDNSLSDETQPVANIPQSYVVVLQLARY